jgi:hypothetical protein
MTPDFDQMQATAERNLKASAEAAGIWQPQHALGVKFIAEMVARHCHRVVTIANAGLALPKAVEDDMQESREVIRHVLFNWWWTDPGAPTPPLRSDGIPGRCPPVWPP